MPWYPCKGNSGAKSVWIGEQQSYDSLDSYDPEICYIIMARGQVVRCYAGTVIIYDVPVIWDYVIENRVISPGTYIDSGISVETSDALNLTWEYYFKATNINQDSFGNPPAFGWDISTRIKTSNILPTFSWDSSYSGSWYRHWYIRGVDRVPGASTPSWLPDEYKTHFYIHVYKPESNGSIYASYIDIDNTGEEIDLTPIPASYCLIPGNNNKIVFGQTSGGSQTFTIEEFKFRWLT